MARKNYTSLTEFILLGLTDTLELQLILFCLFSVIYMLTFVGNVGMIFLIRMDFRLHTPMYFFLANLSFVDVCYSSTITPKMLVDFFIREENHLLSWLLSADVLLYSLGHKWMHPFWVNGPWLLCGHMPPSPLSPDRVQDGPPESGSRGFYSRPGELCGSHRLCEQLVIVQFQWHPSLLLWHPSNF